MHPIPQNILDALDSRELGMLQRLNTSVLARAAQNQQRIDEALEKRQRQERNLARLCNTSHRRYMKQINLEQTIEEMDAGILAQKLTHELAQAAEMKTLLRTALDGTRVFVGTR